MISIIIPTKDRAFNIACVLESLIRQTAQNFEVIIADNQSKDSTKEVVKSYKKICKFPIKYIYVDEDGYAVSIARNEGARNANTDNYLFIDSDIILGKDVMKEYEKYVNKYPHYIVAGPYDWLPPLEFEIKDIKDKFDDIVNCRVPRKEFDYIIMEYKDPRTNVNWNKDTIHTVYAGEFISGNILVPKKEFWSVDGYSEDMKLRGQDNELGRKLCAKGYKLVTSGKLRGWHLDHYRDQERHGELVLEGIKYIHKKHNLEPITPDWEMKWRIENGL